MLTGYTPFAADDALGTCARILRGDVKLPRFLLDDLNAPARGLLRRLLVADVTRRYGCLRHGAADVQQHDVSWCKGRRTAAA